MRIETTEVFNKTLDAFVNKDVRIIISYGGTSSSKSLSIYQLLLLYAIKNQNKRIAIIGESIPVVKRNIINDLKNYVMKDIWNPVNFNKQDMIYKFGNGTTFQFLSGSNPDSFRGYRSDVAYFDEISNIPKDSYDQISIRCKEKVLCSFNPTNEFFIVEDMARPDASVIKSTYRDNPFLDERIITELLQKASRSTRFNDVYIEGNFGVADGIIFEENKAWFITEDFPETYKWRVFGMDFGFTNDPTTLIELRYYDGKVYVKEHIHKTRLLNSDIIKYIKDNVITDKIMADPSSPKDIEEISRAGIYIEKGNNAIMNGINHLLQQELHIYYESINTIKELRNYSYIKDKASGKFINKPIDLFNHSIDAMRYAISEKLNIVNDPRIVTF